MYPCINLVSRSLRVRMHEYRRQFEAHRCTIELNEFRIIDWPEGDQRRSELIDPLRNRLDK